MARTCLNTRDMTLQHTATHCITLHHTASHCNTLHGSDMSQYAWHDSFICVTWLILMCDTTYSHAWHDSFTCLNMRDMTRSYVWHDSFTCVKWLIHMRDTTHSHVHRKSSLLKTPFHVPNRDTMGSNIKISDHIVYFWLQGDSEEAKFQRPSSLIAATKSGASGLAERASMMPFASCIYRATWRQPVQLQLDAPQKSHKSCPTKQIDGLLFVLAKKTFQAKGVF